MWRLVVKQHDPIRVKAAQDERSKLMEGDPAGQGRLWSELETKLLDWEAKMIEFERRVDVRQHIAEVDKVRIAYDMIPIERRENYYRELQCATFMEIKKNLIQSTALDKSVTA